VAFNKQQWIVDGVRNKKYGVFKPTCHLVQQKHCRHCLSVAVLTAVTLLLFSPRLSCYPLFAQNVFIPDCYKWFFNECCLWREATLLSYIRMSWFLNVLCLRKLSHTKQMIYIYIYIRVCLFFLATKQVSIIFDVRSLYGAS
jgi:hypothetical protein